VPMNVAYGDGNSKSCTLWLWSSGICKRSIRILDEKVVRIRLEQFVIFGLVLTTKKIDP
jgi:hypothetical protein